MSKHPLKKSDMGKAWIKPRRNIYQMIAPEFHLIVSEGTDTEPAYFESLKKRIESKYRGRIFLDISGKGDNTLSLFNRAVNDVSKSNIIYKHVWLVYDKDDFPAEHFDRTAQLCLSFNDKMYKQKKNNLLSLVQTIILRINALNDGSYVVVDEETPKLLRE